MKYSNEGRTNYYNLFDEKPRCYHVMKEFISAKHVHRETEITYPVNGSVDVVVREKTFHVQMQDMLIIPRNAMHYYIRIDPDIDIVNVKFADEWLVPAFSDPHALEYMKQFFSCVNHFSANPFISSMMSKMINCEQKPFSDYFLWGCLIELISEGMNNQHWIKDKLKADIESARYIEDLLLFVREHCYSELTLKMLADHVGLTESYCSKYFKQNVGSSFLDYVTTRRVSHAQRLLKYTDYSITEIIEMSGFSSIQTFNRVFKKQTGMTPTEYRKK